MPAAKASPIVQGMKVEGAALLLQELKHEEVAARILNLMDKKDISRVLAHMDGDAKRAKVLSLLNPDTAAATLEVRACARTRVTRTLRHCAQGITSNLLV